MTMCNGKFRERRPRDPGRPRARDVLLAAAMAVVLAMFAETSLGAAPKTSASLVVDYGDGVEVHFTDLKWREGMTVLDALSAAKAHRHGIAFTQRGTGSSALVTKIGDVANEGDGKNWIYSVNGKTGEVSAGVQQLKGGDAVLWRFQKYEYNP
jgi:hypothetical protein